MADSSSPRTIVFWLWTAEMKPTNLTAITQAMTSAVSVAIIRIDRSIPKHYGRSGTTAHVNCCNQLSQSGDCATLRFLFAKIGVNECYGDVTTVDRR